MEEYKIPLRNSKKKIIDYAFVSEEDYEKVNKHKWNKWSTDVDKSVYALSKQKGDTIKMHQFIMGKAPEGLVIDHWNGNGLDNRKENLRFITPQQNGQNIDKREGLTSKYKGVCYHKTKKNWTMHYSKEWQSSHKTEEEAAEEYDKYVLLKFGEGARTNGLILWEDVKHLKLEDEFKKKIKILPTGISYNKKGNYYLVHLQYNKVHYRSKIYVNLQDAINELENVKNTIQLIKDMEDKLHIDQKITRNANGIAIIHVKNETGEILCEALVDDEHWHDLKQYSWYLTKGYVNTKIKEITTSMHGYLMKKVYDLKPTKTEIIDHDNKIKHDNRMCNLRMNTHSGNGHNKTKKKNASSKYMGVNKEGEKWRARIQKQGVTYRLGSHDTDIAAAKAYNVKAIELYGEFANLNVF